MAEYCRVGNVDNYNYDLSGPVPTVSVQDDVFNDRDRLGMRLQLGYDNGDDFDMRIIGDYGEIDETCCIGTVRVDNLFSHGGINAGVAIPGTDFVRMLLGSIVFTDFSRICPMPRPRAHSRRVSRLHFFPL